MYRLIIADDEENIRNGMANSLPWRDWGFEVVALCASGQEVLDRMAACRPDVVLSDIRMPGMDGVELMQRLVEDMRIALRRVGRGQEQKRIGVSLSRVKARHDGCGLRAELFKARLDLIPFEDFELGAGRIVAFESSGSARRIAAGIRNRTPEHFFEHGAGNGTVAQNLRPRARKIDDG